MIERSLNPNEAEGRMHRPDLPQWCVPTSGTKVIVDFLSLRAAAGVTCHLAPYQYTTIVWGVVLGWFIGNRD
jgi:hypothetical protein